MQINQMADQQRDRSDDLPDKVRVVRAAEGGAEATRTAKVCAWISCMGAPSSQ